MVDLWDILYNRNNGDVYRVILSVLDPRKCEYLKDYSLDFEHAYMTTYLAAIAAISEDVLQATFANIERRVQLCLDSGGEHFQHLL
jgi:hypothetical protein